MTTKSEGQYQAEFIVSEANKTRSRETVTVLSGQNLKAGHVIGKVTKAGTTTVTADAANTGDGAMGAVTVAADSKVGKYRLTIIEPATNAGAFIVQDPDGVDVGQGDVGTAFTGGGLSFTLADGATDFAAGDAFTIEVDAGSGKVVEHDPAGTNGSEVAAGILLGAVDATSADKAGAIIASDAEVNLGELVFKTGMSQGDQDKAIADLKSLGILAR
jgi:hypothetical protein